MQIEGILSDNIPHPLNVVTITRREESFDAKNNCD